MTATPIWFGPEERLLFGWCHAPDDGLARGVVVLCPTIGIEAVNSHAALRRLAERLATAGLVVLRFDYDGTGDSTGTQADPGRVSTWLASIRTAIAWARALEVGSVTVIGLRIGATLAAAEISQSGGVDALVLWDPCFSGRRLLREQQVLGAFIIGSKEMPTDGSVETPGLVYGPETVADLSALQLSDLDSPSGARLLVLLREGRKIDARASTWLVERGAEVGSTVGQDQLIDVEPFAAVVPEATLDRIATWVSEGAVAPLMPVVAPTVRRAVVGHDEQGRPIIEKPVLLGSLGLFGMITEVEGVEDAPLVLFSNAGRISHVGPARLWVELARQWAPAGLRSLRFDLSGLGDSPVHEGQVPGEPVPPEGLDDMREVLGVVFAETPSAVVLVGLCSGSCHAIEGAFAQAVDGICAVNPVLNFTPPEARAGREVDARRRASGTTRRWARMLPAHGILGPWMDRLPNVAWWMVNRFVVESPPACTLERLVDTGADVFIIAGANEVRVLSRGRNRHLRRLAQSGRFQLHSIPTLEHTLFEADGRRLAAQLLTDHVIGRFAPSTSPNLPFFGSGRAKVVP